jgi:hypothetical protein
MGRRNKINKLETKKVKKFGTCLGNNLFCHKHTANLGEAGEIIGRHL